MSIILFLVFGLIVGALARLIVPGREAGGWGLSMILGVVGLFLGGMLRALTHYFRARDGISQRWLLLTSLLALAGVFVHALVDFPLQIASIQLYAVVLLAVCWSAARSGARY